MNPIGSPPPPPPTLPEVSGAAAVPIVETGPKRPWDPTKGSLGDLLKQIGEEMRGSRSPSPTSSTSSSDDESDDSSSASAHSSRAASPVGGHMHPRLVQTPEVDPGSGRSDDEGDGASSSSGSSSSGSSLALQRLFGSSPDVGGSSEDSDDETSEGRRSPSPLGAEGGRSPSPDVHQMRRLSVVGTPPPPTLITPDEDADKNPQCKKAWALGDIEPSGRHNDRGNPIWQLKGQPQNCFVCEGGDITGMSDPATVFHEPDFLHGDFWSCVYGSWCVPHFPTSAQARKFDLGFDERYGPR